MGTRESQANEIRMKEKEDKNAEKGQLSKIEAKKKAKNQKTKLNRKIRKSEQDKLRNGRGSAVHDNVLRYLQSHYALP